MVQAKFMNICIDVPVQCFCAWMIPYWTSSQFMSQSLPMKHAEVLGICNPCNWWLGDQFMPANLHNSEIEFDPLQSEKTLQLGHKGCALGENLKRNSHMSYCGFRSRYEDRIVNEVSWCFMDFPILEMEKIQANEPVSYQLLKMLVPHDLNIF